MSTSPKWYTVREIDELLDLPKGSAFRRFKKIEAFLEEGEDFLVLHHEHDRAAIEPLRAADRIYEASINIVLISTETYERSLKNEPM